MSIEHQLFNHASAKANELMILFDMISINGFNASSNASLLGPQLSFGSVTNEEALKTLLTQIQGTASAIKTLYPDLDITPDQDEIDGYSAYVTDLAHEQLNAVDETDPDEIYLEDL